MDEGKALTPGETEMLTNLLKRAFTKIYVTSPSESEIKRNCRYADNHLFAFLSYLGISTEEVMAISKGAYGNDAGVRKDKN